MAAMRASTLGAHGAGHRPTRALRARGAGPSPSFSALLAVTRPRSERGRGPVRAAGQRLANAVRASQETGPRLSGKPNDGLGTVPTSHGSTNRVNGPAVITS